MREKVFLDVGSASEFDYFSLCLLLPMLERYFVIMSGLKPEHHFCFFLTLACNIYPRLCYPGGCNSTVSSQTLDSLERKHSIFTLSLMTGCAHATVVTLSYVI